MGSVVAYRTWNQRSLVVAGVSHKRVGCPTNTLLEAGIELRVTRAPRRSLPRSPLLLAAPADERFMTLSTRTLGLALLLSCTALIALNGCSSDKNSTRAGVGQVRMFVTDAPAAIDAVHLIVGAVAVHHAGGDSVGGWETLRADSATFDLLTLQGGVLASLANGSVPAGHYDQVRFILGVGSTVVVDGITHPLEVPSGTTSGLKVFGAFDVPDGGAIDMALDFDAARSIHETGAGTWIMRPVIRLIAVAQTGTITGALSPTGAVTSIAAIMGGDTLQTTAPADTSTRFTLAGLPAGSYTVAFKTTALYRDTSLTDVDVTVGGHHDVGTVTLTPR
jgi:Domain of unknown function (DUF4382)